MLRDFWRTFWFILFLAGVVGGVYYGLIGMNWWPLGAAMLVLTVFSFVVLQQEWHTSKQNRTWERIKAQEEASLQRELEHARRQQRW